MNPGYELERQVGAIYRALGAKVTHDIALAGNQIDMLITESTPSGAEVKIAVECKAYSRPVGIEVVNFFAALSQLLKQRGLIERSTIVATAGFTRQARDAAAAHGIELLELADLEQRAGPQTIIASEQEATSPKILGLAAAFRPRGKRIFVVMSFASEFNDVYILGIREVVEKLNFVVERADEIEHNGNILAVIYDKIRFADAVIAETTMHNPNVFYELGYAHALGKPTILIARKGSDIPFDIQSENHILYGSIVELREKLERRLQESLEKPAT